MMKLFRIPQRISRRRAEATGWTVMVLLAFLGGSVGLGLHYFVHSLVVR